jgi:hypothetical protein
MRFQLRDDGPYSIVVIYESAYIGPINGVWVGKLSARGNLRLVK